MMRESKIEWHNAADALPESYTDVLICFENGKRVAQAELIDGDDGVSEFQACDCLDMSMYVPCDEVLWWAFLPEPPENGRDE